MEVIEKKQELSKYIKIESDCEIAGFVQLLSISKFFKDKLSDYYGNIFSDKDGRVALEKLNKILDCNKLYGEGYNAILKESINKNSYKPFQQLFIKNADILASFNYLQSFYQEKIYKTKSPNFKVFTEKLSENLVRANMQDNIEEMFAFFGYTHIKDQACRLFIHNFQGDNSKGECIKDLGIFYGLKNKMPEFELKSSDIDGKEWGDERKNGVKTVIQYFPAPVILHEMVHYYYHQSGQLKQIEEDYESRFILLSQEILKLNEKHLLPCKNKNYQAFALLNEVIATSFQGILQERLNYQSNPDGILYDTNDLVDQVAKEIISTVKKYIKDKKQIDEEFILSFLDISKKVCVKFNEIDTSVKLQKY